MHDAVGRTLATLCCVLCLVSISMTVNAELPQATRTKVAVKKEAAAPVLVVAVSCSNFQEERWKGDEAVIKKTLTQYGADYLSADAQASNEKQMRDIDAFVARGVKAIIVLAWDAEAILPAIERAKAQG